MEDKVSMIVAIYNSEKFLDKLINSTINQTYKNIEIILVDDGSPDNSGKICDEYAKKDYRIKVIHKENGGVSDARNEGLKIATGEWVFFIDGDDWLAEDFTEYMMSIVKSTNTKMAFSYNIFTTRDNVQVKKDRIETWCSEDAIAAIIYPYMKMGPWNKIYNMKLLKENNLNFSMTWFGEGINFATKAAKYAGKVGVGYRKVYNYRLNNYGSGLTNYKVQHGLDALEHIKITKEELKINDARVENALNWHIWKNHSFLLVQIIGTNSKDKYIKEYKECIKYIRKNFINILIKSKVNLKEKIKILACGICPEFYTKLVIKVTKRRLQKDNME